MSTYRIPKAAWGDSRLRGEDLRVLGALEAYPPDRERGGMRWPSQGRLAADLQMSRPNVNRAIRRLEEYGYLTRVGRSGRRTCAYFLLVPTERPTPAAASDTRSCITGDTQALSLSCPPPMVPPRKRDGDNAASPGGDKSPMRRPGGRQKRGAGRSAGTPPPCAPRPSARGGGVPAVASKAPDDSAAAAAALARQAGRSATQPTRAPPLTPVQRAIASGQLSKQAATDLWKRAAEIGEAAACREIGFSTFGRPPNQQQELDP